MARKIKLSRKSIPICEDLSFSSKEAYNAIATNLSLLQGRRNEAFVYSFTSATPGDGKTHSAINIAYALAKTGSKVLLLDCDLRKPSIASRLKIVSKEGLVSLLLGNNLIDEVIVKNTPVENMDVIVPGVIPPNPIGLLKSKEMADTILELKKRYDYILIDLPPVNSVIDTIALADVVDGVVLVVRQQYTQKKHIKEATRQLDFARIPIVGIIYNGFNVEEDRYTKSYYGYYYR